MTDKIYLLIKNPKTLKTSKKLNPINIRLYFIKAKKEIVRYQFELPKNAKVNLVFYILLL